VSVCGVVRCANFISHKNMVTVLLLCMARADFLLFRSSFLFIIIVFFFSSFFSPLTHCKPIYAHNLSESHKMFYHVNCYMFCASPSHRQELHSYIKQTFNHFIISGRQQNCRKFVKVWLIVDGFVQWKL